MIHAAKTHDRTAPRSAPAAVAAPGAAPRAFTLVELLVVIAIIGILIGALLVVSGRVIGNQKRTYTQQIMRNITLAIDGFESKNPLANYYDTDRAFQARFRDPTFGPYPPYQVNGAGTGGSVGFLLDPGIQNPAPSPPFFNTLTDRVRRDLAGSASGPDANWVSINDGGAAGNANNDIRALYIYLRVFNEAGTQQIPADAIKPLNDPGPNTQGEFVNPSGRGTNPANANSQVGLTDVFGFYDGWGVPLDYLLYIKVERFVDSRLPTSDGNRIRYRITDRKPVLRSHGVSREQYDGRFAAGALDDQEALYSEPLPSPVRTDPNYPLLPGLNTNPSFAGWIRAQAQGDRYGYIPP